MEWVLQLLDEVDDALAALAHLSVGAIPWAHRQSRRALHCAPGLKSLRATDDPIDTAAGHA
ncbi:MAG: hypothetical protein KGL92_00495 [Gammaproteobacteria bacterium]|nr:hypothetical protein [Gammaproteobacteria bacterium]MDE2346956.1 hypothetical protein [Gammaproteobacteria bacterium]